jgi:hypothetical protein
MVDGRWLPDESIYLERSDLPYVRPSRPYNQGDIFADVPIATAGRGDNKPKIVLGPVLILGHPCSIHAGGRIIETQFVASVRPVEEAVPGRPFGPPWDTHRFLFPLPGLRDGHDFVADFRRVGTTHFKNLEARRTACLTQDGWAALQRRWAWHTLRADIPLEQRSDDLRGLWNELALWEEWSVRGFPPEEFLVWRDSPQVSGSFVGTKRVDLVDYAFDELWAELPAHGQEGR